MHGLRNHYLNVPAIGLVGGTLLLLLLSASGVFDPKPEGQVVWQNDSVLVQADAGSTETVWLSAPIPDASFALKLTAQHESGEKDAAYGLMLGQEGGELVVAVSPMGYVAIWKQSALPNLEAVEYLFPWQTWPHVNPGNQENEFLIEARGDKIMVRLNRERLWEGSGFTPINRAGLIVKSFGTRAGAEFGGAALFLQGGK